MYTNGFSPAPPYSPIASGRVHFLGFVYTLFLKMGRWALLDFFLIMVFCHLFSVAGGAHACGKIFSCVFAIQIDYVENLIMTLNPLCGSQKAVLEFDF